LIIEYLHNELYTQTYKTYNLTIPTVKFSITIEIKAAYSISVKVGGEKFEKHFFSTYRLNRKYICV